MASFKQASSPDRSVQLDAEAKCSDALFFLFNSFLTLTLL